MLSMKYSAALGQRRNTSAYVVLAAIFSFALPPASAEDTIMINGNAVDSYMVDVYVQSRVKKPLDQISEDERARFVVELGDVLALANSNMAKDFEKNPEVVARIKLQRMGILAQAVATKMAADIVISEEEIQASYDEQIKLAPSRQYKARHILVETQGEAVEVIKSLDAGTKFGELAKEHSKDSSGQSGGDLGWFTANQMVKPFSDAVIALENGSYTGEPVQSQFGWHVILRDETRATEPLPLEGVRENIVAHLQSEKLSAMIDQLKSGERK